MANTTFKIAFIFNPITDGKKEQANTKRLFQLVKLDKMFPLIYLFKLINICCPDDCSV